MKRLKNNRKKTIITIAILAAAAAVAAAIIVTGAGMKRGGTSDHYDLKCLTEPRQNPLQDCKEGK